MKKQIFWYRQVQFFRVEILGEKLVQTQNGNIKESTNINWKGHKEKKKCTH